MASAVYGNNPKLCVNDNFDNAEFKNQYTIQSSYYSMQQYNCSGFVAVSHSDEAIILSFRGSENYIQILTQGVISFTHHYYDFPAGGHVNPYFSWAYAHIWKSGMKKDFTALRKSYPSYEVWVTGHSLGGALASVAAGMISHKNYAPAEKIKLITYGQPRVGNKEYVAVMSKLVPNAFRIVHGYDIVTRIPPELSGYVHYGTEIWNNMTDGLSYRIYPNDKGINSISFKNLNRKDHSNYFNMSTDFAKNGCPRSTSKIWMKYLKMFLNAIMKLIYWACIAYGLFVIISLWIICNY